MDFLILIIPSYVIINFIVTMYFLIAYIPENFYSNYDLFLYPLLIEDFRDKLNIPGTIIATALISIFLFPAIIITIVSGWTVFLISALIELFCKLFARKD